MHERILRPLGRTCGLALIVAIAGCAPAGATTCAAVDTPSNLAATLNPGETGCVRAGIYTGSIKITRPGITITSYPGERARIFGRVWIAAADVTVSRMDLDARQSFNQPNVLITADRARVLDSDITNGNTAICVNIGAATWGPHLVRDAVISGNRIHDCGRLPATNHDHGIYVENSIGARILGNVIYDNADRAINLYPNADSTLVRGNVMDGNGEGVLFSGDLGMTSDDNVVEGNVITNPKLREAVESWWADAPVRGTGNVVRSNCIHGGAGTIDASGGGFTVGVNRFENPRYADRAAKDFRLAPDSPCLELLTTGDVVSLPEPAAPAAPASPPPSSGTAPPAPAGPTPAAPAALAAPAPTSPPAAPSAPAGIVAKTAPAKRSAPRRRKSARRKSTRRAVRVCAAAKRRRAQARASRGAVRRACVRVRTRT